MTKTISRCLEHVKSISCDVIIQKICKLVSSIGISKSSNPVHGIVEFWFQNIRRVFFYDSNVVAIVNFTVKNFSNSFIEMLHKKQLD